MITGRSNKGDSLTLGKIMKMATVRTCRSNNFTFGGLGVSSFSSDGLLGNFRIARMAKWKKYDRNTISYGADDVWLHLAAVGISRRVKVSGQ